MHAAVLSIGTELTRGELVNTNAAWLGEQLTGIGFEVAEHCSIDDDEPRIVAALQRLATVARFVVCTGGLGPTSDDRTTSAAAQAAGVRLVRDEVIVTAIRQRWSNHRPHQAMPLINEKQADLPQGAVLLPNANGTAPGFALQLGEARFFFMPGVPGEMRPMFEQHVAPVLRQHAPRTSHQLHLRTFGWPESQVAAALTDLEQSRAAQRGDLLIGYRAHFPEIEVKIWARGKSPADAAALATEMASAVRQRLGSIVYGERDDSFPGVVGQLLQQHRQRIAIAESCTGGLVGEMLTSVRGSSDYVLLDVVAYANAAKVSMLGVDPELLRSHGAVSSATAAAMAEGARQLVDADLAIATTGIAGPDGGTADKPVGTLWLAIARRDTATLTQHHELRFDRRRNRILASYLALDLLRQHPAAATPILPSA